MLGIRMGVDYRVGPNEIVDEVSRRGRRAPKCHAETSQFGAKLLMINVLCLPERRRRLVKVSSSSRNVSCRHRRGFALREPDLPITFLRSPYFENTADLPLGVNPPGPTATTTA